MRIDVNNIQYIHCQIQLVFKWLIIVRIVSGIHFILMFSQFVRRKRYIISTEGAQSDITDKPNPCHKFNHLPTTTHTHTHSRSRTQMYILTTNEVNKCLHRLLVRHQNKQTQAIEHAMHICTHELERTRLCMLLMPDHLIASNYLLLFSGQRKKW